MTFRIMTFRTMTFRTMTFQTMTFRPRSNMAAAACRMPRVCHVSVVLRAEGKHG